MIDLTPYLRAPYLDAGRTMEGLDCWGLMLLVRAELGMAPLPSLLDTTRHTVLAMGRQYRSISETLESCSPEPGAIAAVFRASAFVHVGVCVEVDGRLGVLETNEATGPRWMPVSRFLDSYYRVIFYRDRNLSE